MKFESLRLLFETGDFATFGECNVTFTNNILGQIETIDGELFYYNKEKLLYVSGFPKVGE